MKEKIIAFVAIFILLITMYNVNVEASELGGTLAQLSANSKFAVYLKKAVSGGYQYYMLVVSESLGHDEVNLYITDNTIYATPNNSAYAWITPYWFPDNDIITNLNGTYRFLTSSTTRAYSYGVNDTIIVLKGIVNIQTANKNVTTYDDYIESLKPKWYENAWDTFVDYFTNPVPFQWFKNLINRVFDDDEQTNISDGVNLTNPTLTPPPTPIPYSTVVIPKTDINTGETYYETNYIYAGPSGTPIVQPYPPTSQPSGNTGGSSDNYYPVDGEPLSLPKLKWLSPVTIGDTNYDGIDSIYDGLSSVDDIGSEYTDGISAVSDATSVLPTNWLMLIGIAAAIPLLAGIISRFLS